MLSEGSWFAEMKGDFVILNLTWSKDGCWMLDDGYTWVRGQDVAFKQHRMQFIHKTDWN